MPNVTAAEADGHARGTVPPILFVLAAALLWSTGGLFIKSTKLGALELSFGRSLLAALTVAVLTRREGFRLDFMTLVASVLYAAPLVFKERFRGADLYVVAACVAGMSLFFVGQLRPDDVTGNLMALGSGLCFALFLLLLRRQRGGESNRASSVIYGNIIICLVTLPAFARAAGTLAVKDVLIVSYLGVFQLGLAYTLFTLGIARGVRSLDAGVVGYIEPMLNPVWVFLFLGERPSKWAVLGGCIIIAAVLAHTIGLARASSRGAGRAA